MIAAAEKLYGPYRWGRYDMLVLPPSFPFGGMENPRLTFLTPTVLAGDRALVSLVAHELAHSWSGNLVTNATWNDFWLNEGFTVYVEHRIMEELRGREYADMLWSCSAARTSTRRSPRPAPQARARALAHRLGRDTRPRRDPERHRLREGRAVPAHAREARRPRAFDASCASGSTASRSSRSTRRAFVADTVARLDGPTASPSAGDLKAFLDE